MRRRQNLSGTPRQDDRALQVAVVPNIVESRSLISFPAVTRPIRQSRFLLGYRQPFWPPRQSIKLDDLDAIAVPAFWSVPRTSFTDGRSGFGPF